jgi:uncharacterized membrane protein
VRREGSPVNGGPFSFSTRNINGRLIKWLELKLAAKRLLQLTSKNTVLIFTQKSVLLVAKRVAQADFSLIATLLALLVLRVDVLAAVLKRLYRYPIVQFYLRTALFGRFLVYLELRAVGAAESAI